MGLTKAERWYRAAIKRSQNEIFTETLLVTPEMAKLLLANNPENRALRSAKLAQIVDDMKNGRWKLNLETVIVAKTGELNDGQHRLEGIVRSGTSQMMLIAFGAERETRDTIDVGVARSAGDHLTLSGVQYGSSIAAVARIVIAYEGAQGAHMGRANEVSASAIVDRAQSDPLLRECAVWAHIHKKRGALSRASIIGFLFYMTSKIDPMQAKLYMEGLKEGIGLAADSPIRAAREKIINSPRLSTNEIIEVLVRGWNNWIEGKRLNRIAVLGTIPTLSRGRVRNTSAAPVAQSPALQPA